ncbi:MAG: hypothetical protein ACTSQE_07685 [Candidatus Heimdallarchaeaceae archaeon]
MGLIVANNNLLVTDSGLLFPFEIEKNVSIFGLDNNGEISANGFAEKKEGVNNRFYTLFSYSGEIDLNIESSLWCNTGLISCRELLDIVLRKPNELDKYRLDIVSYYKYNLEKIFTNRDKIKNNGLFNNLSLNPNIAYLFGLLSNIVDINSNNIYVRTVFNNGSSIIEWIKKILKNDLKINNASVKVLNHPKWDIIKINSFNFSRLYNNIINKYGNYPIFLRNSDKEIFFAYCEGIFNINTEVKSRVNDFTFFLNNPISRKILFWYFILKDIKIRFTPQPRRFPVKFSLIIGEESHSIKRSNKEISSILPIYSQRYTELTFKDKYWNPICNSFLIH